MSEVVWRESPPWDKGPYIFRETCTRFREASYAFGIAIDVKKSGEAFVGRVVLDDGAAILGTREKATQALAAVSARLMAVDVANALLRLAGEEELKGGVDELWRENIRLAIGHALLMLAWTLRDIGLGNFDDAELHHASMLSVLEVEPHHLPDGEL